MRYHHVTAFRPSSPHHFLPEGDGCTREGLCTSRFWRETRQCPREEELPEPLALLSMRNAVEVRDGEFDYDVDRVIRQLKDLSLLLYAACDAASLPRSRKGDQQLDLPRRTLLSKQVFVTSPSAVAGIISL